MNQGVHLYAVSARLLEAAEYTDDLAGATTTRIRETLHSAMQEMGKADRPWGSVTTAMPPIARIRLSGPRTAWSSD